ncbi:MAG: hypothetical protein ACFFC7_24305 [Candidatus Hermodarchaeota archaeon]
MFKEIKNHLFASWSITFIGTVHRQLGNLEQALEQLEEGLALQEKLGNKQLMSETLFYLVGAALDNSSPEQARKYLQYLQEISEQTKNKVVRQRYHVAEALLLKSSTRAREKLRAADLLEQVADSEVVYYELTVTALLHLCELLLIELDMTGDPKVLDEVRTRTVQLRDLAQEHHSYWLLTETYLLESKLALVELNINTAQLLLDQAQLTAEEKNLGRLIIEISREQELFQEQLNKWKLLIERNAPMKERLELAQLEDRLIRVARKKLMITEQDILAYAQSVQSVVESLKDDE